MLPDTAPATPLRALGTREPDGWIRLSDPASAYRDGGELRVRQIIESSSDISAASQEMLRRATSWPEAYHLNPARANALRALDLAPEARVLEVGAGCGAVTRYLGETCAVVDALEPVPDRASAASARTRDLPGVRVFVGSVHDVPAEPVYDAVVVVGVLEYVGSGSADPQPYRSFLRRLARVLRPGGTLVLAIENKLGVKYLCGAPEDHSGRPYDSVEGYPEGSPARTFSRAELVSLLADAGLAARPLIAFPDYKLTRVVFDAESLPPEADSLLYRVPDFPSPDYLAQRPAGPAEGLVWRSLVQAGLAGQSGNSFVVLASTADRSPLWPDGRAGVFFGTNRPPAYAMRTEIRCVDGDVSMERSFVVPEADRRNPLSLSIHPVSSDFVPGTDLLDEIVDTDDPRTVSLLHAWRDLVDEDAGQQAVTLDLVPRNLVLSADGTLTSIDQEWTMPGIEGDDVLRRGAMLTAVHLWLRGRLAGHWTGCATVGDVARAIGATIRAGWDPGWLDAAVAAEAAFQAEVSVTPGVADKSAGRDVATAFFRSVLDAPVPGPAGPSGFAHSAVELARLLAQSRDSATELSRLLEQQQATAQESRRAVELQTERGDAERARADQAVAELQAVRRTLSWRVTGPLRWVRGRLPR